MRLDLTKHTLVQTTVTFFLLFILFLTSDTISYHEPTSWRGYTHLAGSIFMSIGAIPMLAIALSLTLTVINSFLVTRIMLRFISLSDKNYIAAITYLTLTAATSSLTSNFHTQAIIFLIIVSIETIFMLNRYNDIVRQTFLACTYTGIASILFLPSALLYLALFVYMITYRIVTFKGLLASVTGLLLPLFLYCYITWAAGGKFLAPVNEIYDITDSILLHKSFSIFTVTIPQYIFIALCIFLAVQGFWRMAMAANHINAITVRSYVCFMYLLVVLTVMLVLAYGTSYTLLPLMTVPLSVIISVLFRQMPNIYVKNAIAIAFVILALIIA
ncbi:MAG: hypothetical protein K2N86_03650 [Rikenellaceae bacterium]|nr:hypothetical protein [Rikenellaceae bacterium]MDE7356319.1 hypothetical protein [Rikenellaceae bacterium]